MIAQETIDKILDASDIVDIVSRFVRIKKSGVAYKGLCPFHSEKTPSFTVNPQKKLFYCFGCQKGGNIIRFLRDINNFSFKESLQYLADEYNISIEKDTGGKKEEKKYLLTEKILYINQKAAQYFSHMLLNSKEAEPARDYLEKRRLSLSDIKTFLIGFSLPSWDGLLKYLTENGIGSLELISSTGLIKKNSNGTSYYDVFRGRVMFPIKDIQGRIIGFGGRIIDGSDKKNAKYINSKETLLYSKGKNLFGLNLSKEHIMSKRQAVIVEGYLDFITAYRNGVKNIVATLGTALTSYQASLIKRFADEVILVFDGDNAGKTAAAKGYNSLTDAGGLEVKTLLLPNGSDPDSFIKDFGALEFCNRLGCAEPFIKFMIDNTAEEVKVHGADSIRNKADSISKLLAVISSIPNIIEKTGYIAYLSEQTGVSQHALQKELQRISSAQKKDMKTNAAFFASPKKNKAEYLLLQTLLHNLEKVGEAKKYISAADFYDNELSNIAEVIFKTTDIQLTLSDIIGTLDGCDGKLSDIVSQMMVEEIEFGDVTRTIYDCIKKIRNRKLIIRKNEIIKKRKEIAKGSNIDRQEYDKLEQEYKLIKKEMIAGVGINASVM